MSRASWARGRRSAGCAWAQVAALTLAEALGGVGAARGAAEGPLEAVVLLGQLLDGLLQVDALLLLILQRTLPSPAVCLR